jgi:hypothetical protein
LAKALDSYSSKLFPFSRHKYIYSSLSIPIKTTNTLPYFLFLQNWLWIQPRFFLESWSLAVEEWFYLLFPIAIFAFHRRLNYGKAFVVSALIFLVIPTILRIIWAFSGHTDWDEEFRKVTVLRLDAIMYGVLAAQIKTVLQNLPNIVCSGRLGLCAFFRLFLELRRFSVSELFSPQPPVTQVVRRLAKPIGKADLHDKETLHEFRYSSNCRSVLQLWIRRDIPVHGRRNQMEHRWQGRTCGSRGGHRSM